MVQMTKLFSVTKGQGQNIVLLHGFGAHSGIWQFIVEELCSDFTVTTIDLPGFGRSEKLADFSLENMISKILECAPSRAIWLGWSLGGLIATKIANLYPERVSKLICVASNPKFIKEEAWPGVTLETLQKFTQQLCEDYEGTLMRFILLQFHGLPVNKKMMSWMQQNMFLYGKPEFDTLNHSLALLEKLDCREVLKKINCKILYILGQTDAIVPSKIVAPLLSNLFNKIKTIVIPKASHAPFLTHQQQFLDYVRQFAHD